MVEVALSVSLRYILCSALSRIASLLLGTLAPLTTSTMYGFWYCFNALTLVAVWAPIVWSLATFLGFSHDDRWSREWRRSRPPQLRDDEHDAVDRALRALPRQPMRRFAVPDQWRVLDGPAPPIVCIGRTLYVTAATLSDPAAQALLAHAIGHCNRGDSLLILALRRLALPPFRADARRWGWIGRWLLAGIFGGIGPLALQRQWANHWHESEAAADAFAAALGEGQSLQAYLAQHDLDDLPAPHQGRARLPREQRPQPLAASERQPSDPPAHPAYLWRPTDEALLRLVSGVLILVALSRAGLAPPRAEQARFLTQYGGAALTDLPPDARVAFEWQPDELSNALYVSYDSLDVADKTAVVKATYYYDGPHSITIRQMSGALPVLPVSLSGSYAIEQTGTEIILRGPRTFVLSAKPPALFPSHPIPSPTS